MTLGAEECHHPCSLLLAVSGTAYPLARLQHTARRIRQSVLPLMEEAHLSPLPCYTEENSREDTKWRKRPSRSGSPSHGFH